MTKYKNLLLALGITISGAPIANASMDEDNLERTPICKKYPSSFFLEITPEKDMDGEYSNVGCSVSNSACGK